jgi:hypothetical protein
VGGQEEAEVTAACACRAVATAGEDGLYTLAVTLDYDGPAPVDLPTSQPFTEFSLAATAGGVPATVHEPALDIPIHDASLRLVPGEAVTLRTPIRLRIAAGADPGRDGYVWTVAHPPEAVALELRLHLPAPFDLVCPVTLA